MTGTCSKTGAKTGKPADPDNRAESIIPKPVSVTVRAKCTEAGKKAAVTRCANQACKATEAPQANLTSDGTLHNRDGSEAYKTIQQSNEDQSDVSSGRSIGGSVAHDSLQEQEKTYADEDAKIAAQHVMEDKLRKQRHAVAQPTVLKSDSAHGSSEIRNFFDDEVSDTELATLSAPGTPVVNGCRHPPARLKIPCPLFWEIWGSSDYPSDDDSSAEAMSMPNMKKVKLSWLPLKDLKHSNTQPSFALAVSAALRDFHIHLLKQNMFPNEVDARCQILKSVYSTCREEGVDPFEIIHEASGFRSRFKQRAQIIVPLLYNFFGKDQNTAKGIVEAALEFQCYRYEFFMGHPNTPCQNGLGHPAITSIIRTFFETNDVKVFASDIMPNFIEMPIETVAFALTIIHETLLSWKTGVLEQKGQKLSAAVYSQIYQGHVGWIQQWKDKPTRSEEWKKISKDLGEEAAPTDLAAQFVVFDTN
ncbi:hypothetical protein BS47DRAFT_1363978 [Hydnum rufescens UP504]|uniref:DUF6532 domain-containing protein n=1 Tax=Hydnum rufescens UP504 TaxID=1448309 RepID=A0A9P6AT86_9AGAM|nr:hypothetical protein BS47DRAFT_1363978 [Hydnum rufescens UP504]